jgi:hypothetical protein
MQKPLIIVSVIILTAATAVSQKTATRALDHFTGIEVKNGIMIQLVKADKEFAELKVHEIEADDVTTEISDGVLVFRYQAPAFSKAKVMIKLYYKELLSVMASGQSEISSTSLMKQDSLTVDLETGAKAYLDLDVLFLKSKVSEGALLSAEGYAVTQDAYAVTGAALSLFDLESDDIRVKVTTNGKAKLYAEKSLTAEASTGGFISYKGDPEVKNFKTSIGGKIEKYAP